VIAIASILDPGELMNGNHRVPLLVLTTLAALVILAGPPPAGARPLPGETTMHCQTVHSDDGAVPEELARTFEHWAERVAAADAEGLAELITEDATFWSPGREALTGRVAAIAAFREVFGTYRMRQAFECEELVVAGEWAFVRGLERNQLVPQGGGEPLEVLQRAFSVLHRDDDGTWRFARGMTHQGPGSD
jgi:uncharacterized protein (TIGR02246 family)